MKQRVLGLIGRYLRREIDTAHQRWKSGLSDPERRIYLLIAAISMYALWYWAFDQGLWFGVAFVIAASLSITRDHIFTHPYRLALVAVATVIGSQVIPGLRGDAWELFRGGKIIPAAIISAIVLGLWLFSRQLGTDTFDVEASPRRKRTIKRRNSRRKSPR